MVRRGFEKLSQIRHEQTRPGVGRRGNAANAIVVVGVHLPPNIDEALADMETIRSHQRRRLYESRVASAKTPQ